MAIFVGWTGAKPLAAHQIMLTVSMFFYNIYLGIATAISIRVSHFAGMKEWRAIVDVTKSGFFIIIAIAAFMAIPVYTFRYSIGSLFSDDPLVGIWYAFPVCLTVAGVLYFIILKVKLPR